jgi:hypothetical protein
LAAILPAGCSGGGYSAQPLDHARAREALNTTLDAWKKGQEPASLKTASPPIVAQDMDWSAGATLLAYEVKGDGKGVDSNLKVPVQLTMKTRAGKDATKTVNYLVTTSPAVTVFRDFR